MSKFYARWSRYYAQRTGFPYNEQILTKIKSGQFLSFSQIEMDQTMQMSSSAMEMASQTMDMASSATSMMMSATSMASSMDMASHTMDMASHTMDMASHTMDMASATATGMDMDMGMMGMNMYLTSSYQNYPVLFRTLHASSGGAAFGIFCILFFGGMFFRGLFFLSAYLEQRVFHNFNNAVIIKEVDNCACDPEKEADSAMEGLKSSSMSKFFPTTFSQITQDLVRLVLAFVTAMFGYALMLATMSYVILYFFAVCLGVAFGEVFFNRLSIVTGVNKIRL